MKRFRNFVVAALVAGTAAGLVLFLLQHWAVVPLIDQAEAFEDAVHHAQPPAVVLHESESWHPAPGIQRIFFTALTTMMSGIGFGAILLSVMVLSGQQAGAWRGTLWGLGGFACFVLAPALGLPPRPPGVIVGDLHARQIWWLATVTMTGSGLWLTTLRFWSVKAAGAILLLLPHAIGAPTTNMASVVPRELIRDFALWSVATNLPFWLLLGAVCGALLRYQDDQLGQKGTPTPLLGRTEPGS